MRLPWVKWFPADWSSEPGLRLCCAATRGIWAEALNTMMLRGNDRVQGTLQQLSRLCCCEEQEMSLAVQQLSEQNVAQVSEQNGNIIILNRRLARQLEIKKLRSEAGKISATKRQQAKEQTAQHRSECASEYASAVLKKRGTEEQCVQYCLSRNLTEEDGRWFFDKCEGSGWKNAGKPIVDYQATIRSWKRISIFPSQKSNNGQRNGIAPRQMSAFEIEKRVAAISAEINATFKKNGGRASGDGIDELKQRRDELQKQLLA